MRPVRTFFFLVLAGAFIVAAYAYFGIFVRRSSTAAAQTVIVARGATFREIAHQLAATGLIGSDLLFRAYAKAAHADTGVHAGEFKFAPGQTEAQILAQLQSGGAQVAKWVTFPEGFTAKQFAQRLNDEGLGDAARLDEAFMHRSLRLAGTRSANLEGYLFPSTYLIPLGATPDQITQILTNQFTKALPHDAAGRAKSLGLTVPQVVTVASLVQQEGKADDERPLIAGVIYNRLRDHMPLEVDATLEYTFAHHHDIITYADLKTDSPFNTYKHEGLPPTPIANPGAPSLIAAFHPRPSPYLYYVYKGNGHHAFAKTLSEHQANVQRYLK